MFRLRRQKYWVEEIVTAVKSRMRVLTEIATVSHIELDVNFLSVLNYFFLYELIYIKKKEC